MRFAANEFAMYVFTAAYVAAFWDRLGLTCGWQGRKSDAAISGWRCFLWLYLALCGTGLAVKILV